MRPRSLAVVAVVAAGAAGLTACSDPSFADHAEDYLDDVEGANGEDYRDASCEEPPSRDVGETFPCTATDANGATISFVAEILDDDRYVLREAGSDADSPPSTGGTGTEVPATTSGDTAETPSTTS